MISILNIEPEAYCDEARAILRRMGDVHEEAMGRKKLLDEIHKYDVLITRLKTSIDREVLDAGVRLKAVVTATTGLDHIDTDYAESRGIKVLSLKGEQAFLQTVSATAEHAWALLLSLVRKIPWAFSSVLEGTWDRDEFKGMQLSGKRIGIAGLGRLGEKVARYAQAFGMEVSAYDPYRQVWMDGVRRCETFEDLLRNSDILSLNVPLNSETTGMVGRTELGMLPPHAIIVNTSRGEVIDEDALVDVLENGRLAGAALDVIRGERQFSRDSRIAEYARVRRNLLITPHIGGATRESMMQTEIFMANKLKSYLDDTLSDEDHHRAC